VKITFVLPGYARRPIGGIRVVYTYASGLAVLGHDVSIVHVARYRKRPGLTDGRPRRQVSDIVGGMRDVRHGAPLEVTWEDVDPRVDLRYVPTLSPRSVPDGDVVVATAWQTADGVSRLPATKGTGWYLIQHHETWSGRAQRVDATWRLPLRKVFIAPWLLRRAVTMGLTDVHRVPGAIDTQKFCLVRPIDRRPPRVAMLSSDWAWKGRSDGVSALRECRRRNPSLSAVLFGTGPRPSDLPVWIEYAQNPTQDVLVDDVYNGSSIYLCPSHAEGWHLPPAEAMACGAAVVSTDMDGVADYAIRDRTALLAPVRDVGALAARVCDLLDDDVRRIELAGAGHAHIQQFTWAASTEALAAAFASEPSGVVTA
jgi:glycosyltransferase involved in cell wall biosynthesis